MTKHILEVDGYHVAERLLEGVMFQVHIDETSTDLTITDVTTKPEDAGYLKQINLPHFIPQIRTHVQNNIDHLRKNATERGLSWPAGLLDDWEKEWPTYALHPGETYSRIDVVNEV